MNIGTKKALGIVTCNRPEYFQEILDTTRFEEFDKVYVIDASGNGEDPIFGVNITYIINEEPLVVGRAKNSLLQAMLEDGMDHLFLQEDDVKVTQDGVSDLYIETAKQSGIWGGLNFAWHGNGNKDDNGIPIIKNGYDLDGDLGIITTHNQTAAFSYFHRNIIEKMGMFDEYYQNCWEHMDHFQTLNANKLSSYWWQFPDAKGSENYIVDLDDGKHGGSVIRKDEEWQKNMHDGMDYFKKKHGFIPTSMPHASLDQIESRFQYLIDNYSV